MRDDRLRSIRAENPGPFTLDGTRTYIVGHSQVAVIDPGPDMEAHVRAVSSAIADADEVTILVSHGHGDHVDAVDSLLDLHPDARLIGHGHVDAEEPEVPEEVSPHGIPVATTDVGEVYAIPTPGHTRDHLCFHWPEGSTLFAADMVLGQGDTTWVAEYPGCVADYLASLDRLERLEVQMVLSAHGPPIDDVPTVWTRYREHRLDRIRAARKALADEGLKPGDPRDRVVTKRLLDRIYGDTIPAGLESAAAASLSAVLDYVDTHPGPA